MSVALLSITYTPQYNGCHRVYFRTDQLQYCFYLDTTPTIVGTPKTVEIYLSDYAECIGFIPTEVSCNGDTVVEGYIQPCCSDENSLSNRVEFTATYESTPCTPYSLQCNESGIGEITINNPGYGWTPDITPSIEIVDGLGNGTGYNGTVTMQCLPGDNFCSIQEISIDTAGQGYYDINQLTVNIIPAPTCISNELIVDGTFANGLTDWTVAPNPDSWITNGPAGVKYNTAVYDNSPGGSIEQDIVEPGKTYEINIDEVVLGATAGTVRVIITVGTFSSSGTQSNQYTITRNTGDPIFNSPVSVTLTVPAISNNTFSIFADSTVLTDTNRISVKGVSVIEVCEAINPDVVVSYVDDCGSFFVPTCDGSSNTQAYSIVNASPDFIINVCAGDDGPVGPKYVITENPTGVSCCDCRLYNVIVRNPIDVYYTDCNQTIDVVSVEAGMIGITICAIPNSIWPVNKPEYLEILAITEVGTCVPNG